MSAHLSPVPSNDNEAVVDWRDPPPVGRGAGAPPKWPARLAPLMEYPERWAMVRSVPTKGTATSIAHQLRSGEALIPPGRWEFRSSGVEVFARYLGPSEPVAS